MFNLEFEGLTIIQTLIYTFLLSILKADFYLRELERQRQNMNEGIITHITQEHPFIFSEAAIMTV